jgi:hypothetical protein
MTSKIRPKIGKQSITNQKEFRKECQFRKRKIETPGLELWTPWDFPPETYH